MVILHHSDLEHVTHYAEHALSKSVQGELTNSNPDATAQPLILYRSVFLDELHPGTCVILSHAAGSRNLQGAMPRCY